MFGKIFYNRPLPNKTNANSQKLNEIAIHINVDGLDSGSWRCISLHTHTHTQARTHAHTYVEELSDNYMASFVMQWVVFFCP